MGEKLTEAIGGQEGLDHLAAQSYFKPTPPNARAQLVIVRQVVDQRLEAAKELLFDLEGVADTDVSTLQEMNKLYAFDQIWAQEELAYRKALKKELDDLSNNIVRLDNIARSR